MALTKVRDFNLTGPGKVAQVAIWAARGTDGESYVVEVDPATGAFPIAFGTLTYGFGVVASAQRVALGAAETVVRPVYRDLSSAPLGTAWSEVVASASANISGISILNTSGDPLTVGFGSAGAEASQFIVGGESLLWHWIPQGTRITVHAQSSVTSGYLAFSFFG